VVDWTDFSNEPALLDAALQAHDDAGSRAVVVAATPEWDDRVGEPAALQHLLVRPQPPQRSVAVGLATGDAATWEAGRRLGLRIHAHAVPAPARAGTVADLARAGLLAGDVTLVHHTDLDDRDLDAIASTGAAVSLAPTMEMTDGLGWPPLQGCIDRGIRPGLAVGSEMESPGDMFAQMRLANASQHATVFDLKLAGRGGIPNLLSTRDVIRYGTIDGAAAVGLDGVTGSLTPGKRADVVVLRTDHPNVAPVNDPIGAVVWGMDTSNIDWVIVDGRVVLREGELVADVARARDLAAAAQREVLAASGVLADAGVPRP
jgi:imidazolonepropionase-like amidohydrolase